MSNTNIHPLRQLLTAAVLVTGITLSVQNMESLTASVTQGGTTLLALAATDASQIVNEPTLRAAAVTAGYENAVGANQLVVGILFIVLGGFLHAWYVLKNQEERNVKITIAPKKKRMWFWMEMRV